MRPIAVLLALALLGACAAGFRAWRAPVPDRVEPLGPFEIVTHSRRHAGGWNEGRPAHGVVEHWSLRHRGRRVTIHGRAGLAGDEQAAYTTANAVVTFDAPEPALVVNVGESTMNGTWYYLVRERDGAPAIAYLGATHGRVTAEWLDAPDAAPRTRDASVGRARMPGGGRWLLLGDETVLDTRTLAAHRAPLPAEARPHPGSPALVLAPDAGSVARYGEGPSPTHAPWLLVSDFARDTAYALPIDRRTMRFRDARDVDAAWVAHHFAWHRDADGRDRLTPRPQVAPLPWRGRLTVDPQDGRRSYSVAPVSPAMHERLAALLVRELGATRLPRAATAADPDDVGAAHVTDTFRLGAHVVGLMTRDGTVGVWVPGRADDRVVAEIGERFDARLRSGAYDALFVR